MYHNPGISPSAGLAVASCVLFIYDYAITFAKEMDLFWLQPRWTWGSTFFISNRYIGLFGRIPEFLGIFFGGLHSPVCSGLLLSNRVISAVLQLIGGVIMIARVYAFYNKDRRVLSPLLAVAVVCIGLGCWAFSYRIVLSTSESTAADQGTYAGCREQMTSAEALHWAAAWGGQLVFDALVFIFTLRKLMSVCSLGKRSFMALSLRDGALYFAVMLAANVANIVTYLVMANPYERSMLALPTNMLCAVLISRLMLNLRCLEHELSYTDEIWSIAPMQLSINSGF
ncbi:hypothetical protein EDD17DRAFT_56310 [Pisolithus thermaeus]|nr:hypothetical protein EV401DRAFT_790632 [Pisolithus croceorrhizus]KAI6166392.1 hypothetical protein EDD17DRAFT_56310 [Pisolithus thermaeus]